METIVCNFINWMVVNNVGIYLLFGLILVQTLEEITIKMAGIKRK